MQDFVKGNVRPKRSRSSGKLCRQPGTVFKQLSKIMKLTVALLFAALVNVHASGYSQTVTFSGKDVTLEKIFSEVTRQTGFNFFYLEDQVRKAKLVSIDVRNASLNSVLTICLKDQPFNYSIQGKTIFITHKKESPHLTQGIAPEPASNFIGRIVNIKGEPLVGANVTNKRTDKATISDLSGVFTFVDIRVGDLLTVTYVGYEIQAVKVNNIEHTNIILNLANNELDEMIVQAYGKTTKRLATGNISRVRAEEIEKQPIMNPLLALQGKVAGLEVTQINGYASAPIKVELRGRNSISGFFTSEPLYIVDGVPLTVLEVSSAGEPLYQNGSRGFSQSGIVSPARGQSPLFSINPNDIESIEVLKDADATAIYGSRAANGVILITTKKGKVGKSKLDLHVQNGITKVTRFWDMMNTQQYVAMRKEAFKNDNIDYADPNNLSQAYDLMIWDTTRYTDWQKEIYGGTGRNLDVQASLSGGNSQTSFRLGAGYTKTTSITAVDGSDSKATVSFNFNHKSANQKFSVGLTTNFTYSFSNMVELPGKVTYAPNAPAIFDSLGKFNWRAWGGPTNVSDGRYALQPFSNLKQPYTSKTNFITSNLVLSYQIATGLNFSTSFGYNNAVANQEYYAPIASLDPIDNPTGTAQFGYNFNKNWIIEPQANYSKLIWKGRLDVLAGATLQQTRTDGNAVVGSGYTSDLLLKSITSAPVKNTVDYHGMYKYAAIFGRVNYNLLNRYIINLTARRDGSSRFGEDKQFGNFGSAGFAWIFSEEHFLNKHLSFLSFGKLRASYGLTGSDVIGDYQYLTRWNSTLSRPYMGVSPLMARQHANPDFHWATNKKLEVAVDLSFLHERISVSASYYQNRCNDQLLKIPIGSFTGFTEVTANSPALVQNNGWEFSSSAKIVASKNIGWSVNMNIAINHNKLISYPNFELSPYVGTLIVGQPLNIRRVYHYLGVNPLNGQYMFEDKDHDGQIRKNNAGKPDDAYAIDMSPKFFGGFGTSFNYKSLSLGLVFSFRKQDGVTGYVASEFPGIANVNAPSEVLNHWQKPGDIAQVGRFSTNTATSDNNFKLSDGVFTDASFVRFSNASLSYSLPQQYIKMIGLENCSLFLHANNIFVITKYKGVDPETQNFGGMPPIRTFVGGINFSF